MLKNIKTYNPLSDYNKVIKKLNNKDTFSSVGHYPSTTIHQARSNARDILNVIDEGKNNP